MIELQKITFIEAIKNGFKNYVNFKDRIRRSEFWYFYLFLFFFEILISIGIILTLEPHTHTKGYIYYTFSPIVEVITYIYELLIFCPRISSIVLRLHDIGKNGYYIFIIFVPIVGFFMLIYYLCQDSQKEENKYGPSSKYFFLDEANAPLNQNESPDILNNIQTNSNKIKDNENFNDFDNNQYNPIIEEDGVLPQKNTE